MKPARDRPLRVAMIGDRGIPARYSGFSTLVEEVSTRLVASHGMDVTVYCRSPYAEEHPPEFKGVRLVYLSAPGGKSFESLLHSQRAILHAAMRSYDLAFVVDPGNSPLTWPLALRRMPFVIHTDGMGWKREKWSDFQKRYYRWSESVAARLATGLVCDSAEMREYYLETYGAASAYLPYGALVGDPPNGGAPGHFGLEPGQYHLVVARLEPENNLELIIREYKASKARLPLVYVGGARYESEFSRHVMAQAGGRFRFLGPLYESDILNGLYRHCRSYLHGHEVGGTNPSLLRAMGMGAPCVALDVVFNREVLEDTGRYFSKAVGNLAGAIEAVEADPAGSARMGELTRERARRLFRWDSVAAGYAEFFSHLVRGGGGKVPEVYDPAAFADRDDRVIAAGKRGAPFTPAAAESPR